MTERRGERAPATRAGRWPVAAGLGAVAALVAAGLQVGADPLPQAVTTALTGVACGSSGAILTSLDSRSVVGRVLAWCALTFGLVQLLSELAPLTPDPPATLLAWVTSWAWPVFVVPLLTVLPLGLPDADELGGTDRLWLAVAVTAVSLLCLASATAATIQSQDGEAPNPFWAETVNGATSLAGEVAWVVASVGSIATLVLRWRRADTARRLPIQLVGAALGLVLLCHLLHPVLPSDTSVVIGTLSPIVIVAAITLAAVRYDLPPDGAAIPRAQVHAIATIGVMATYLVSLAILTLSLHQLPIWLAVTGAVAVTAAVLEPARRWARRTLRARVYGGRDDPLAAITRLRGAIEEAGAGEAVLFAMVDQVRRSARLEGAALFLRVEGELVRVGEVGTLGAVGAEVRDVPLVFLAEDLGRLRVSRAHGDMWSDADLRLVEHLAGEIAPSVYVIRARSEREATRRDRLSFMAESRAQLGRDLHDTLGPVLAGTYLAATGLSLRLDDASPEAARARQIADGVQQASSQVRRMIEGLTELDELDGLDGIGLGEAIERRVDQVRAASDLEVDVSIDVGTGAGDEGVPDGLALSPAVSRTAYLIVAEALTNVLRHARAQRASVVVAMNGDGLVVRVSDDGDLGVFVAGVGLRSMRMRAAELGGTCTLRPVRPRGAEVHAELPLATVAR